MKGIRGFWSVFRPPSEFCLVTVGLDCGQIFWMNCVQCTQTSLLAQHEVISVNDGFRAHVSQDVGDIF